MNPRLKKLVGMVLILAYLAAYVWAVITVGGFVPAAWWAQLAFYAVAGMVWWIPLAPAIKWMNREG